MRLGGLLKTRAAERVGIMVSATGAGPTGLFRHRAHVDFLQVTSGSEESSVFRETLHLREARTTAQAVDDACSSVRHRGKHVYCRNH